MYRKTKTIIERTGPAVRAALLKYSSAEECAQFEAEMRSVLARAAEALDLSGRVCCVGGKQPRFPMCCFDQMAWASSVKTAVS